MKKNLQFSLQSFGVYTVLKRSFPPTAAAMTAIKVEYEATISVEQTPSDKKALDSLVYYYHNDPDSTTIKSCREPDVQNCPVPEYIGVEELEVLVVYVDDTKGKPVESEQRTVYGKLKSYL